MKRKIYFFSSKNIFFTNFYLKLNVFLGGGGVYILHVHTLYILYVRPLCVVLVISRSRWIKLLLCGTAIGFDLHAMKAFRLADRC